MVLGQPLLVVVALERLHQLAGPAALFQSQQQPQPRHSRLQERLAEFLIFLTALLGQAQQHWHQMLLLLAAALALHHQQ